MTAVDESSISDIAVRAFQELFRVGDSPEAEATRQRQRDEDDARFRLLVRLIRVVVRAELAAQSELGEDRLEEVIRDAWAALKPFEPVLEQDQSVPEHRLLLHQHLVDGLEAYISACTLGLPDGPEPGDVGFWPPTDQTQAGGLSGSHRRHHRRADLVVIDRGVRAKDAAPAIGRHQRALPRGK
jgi:hypothetical protein